MRKFSYRVFLLNTPYPKILYVNNAYWQATYIADGHLSKEELLDYTKQDHQNAGTSRIKFYSYKDPKDLNPQEISDRKANILYHLTHLYNDDPDIYIKIIRKIKLSPSKTK